MSAKFSLIEIINQLNKIHNNEFSHYDYSLINEENYKNTRNKISIKCNIHKIIFNMGFTTHKRSGCKLCGLETLSKRFRSTIIQLIEDFNKIHNTEEYKNKFKEDHYDYSYIKEYKNGRIKLPIRCIKHDFTFFTSADAHKAGVGCKKCKSDTLKLKLTKSNEYFLEKSEIAHGEDYEYLENYKGSNIKLLMKHKKCQNIFKQRPQHHIRGIDCPFCNQSKANKIIKQILDLFKFVYEAEYHINDCRNILPLPFDFAIFNNQLKLSCLIEFQGRQHFDNGCGKNLVCQKKWQRFNLKN